MPPYSNVPKAAKQQPKPFTAHTPDPAIEEFKTLLKLSKFPPKTYENLQDDRRYGVSLAWMESAKSAWEKFDWRKSEELINSFSNFTLPIIVNGSTIEMHFIALFSDKEEAVPLVFSHGWPGSFLEFLPILTILKGKHSPADLPFHVIVPSLPGYAYSTSPPLDREFGIDELARSVHLLMLELGFGSGYVAQGGDIGSYVSRVIGAKYDECKAVHLNFSVLRRPDDVPESAANDEERVGLERMDDFLRFGHAYAQEHATRPSTIGFVLSSSPIALLAWIGEKFLAWTDRDPPMDEILRSISLYWFTESFPRCIYPYRHTTSAVGKIVHGASEYRINKPLGYSWFPKEIAAVPKSWVEKTGDLVYAKQHSSGGHFAAMERPDQLLQDVTEFIVQVWKP